jgi:hypothetical protein
VAVSGGVVLRIKLEPSSYEKLGFYDNFSRANVYEYIVGEERG